MKSAFAAALALVSVSAWAATPTLSGLYAVGDLGLVDFSMNDGKFVGKLRSSTRCTFVADTPIITGSFEGNVFVGSVTLCLEGAGCAAERRYPVLAVHYGDSVAGWVHLEPGCSSPALPDDNRLFLRPATVEEKQKVIGDSSASALAQKQNRGDATAIAAEAILEGNRLYQDQKFGPAREKFRQAMESDPTRWEAVTGFGLTELKLGFPDRALDNFDKALSVAARRATGSQLAQIHYNRACALIVNHDDKGAISALRSAVKLGGVSLDDLLNDSDLNPLRKDPGFKALIAEVRSGKKR